MAEIGELEIPVKVRLDDETARLVSEYQKAIKKRAAKYAKQHEAAKALTAAEDASKAANDEIFECFDRLYQHLRGE